VEKLRADEPTGEAMRKRLADFRHDVMLSK
jgi:hypothetical protein